MLKRTLSVALALVVALVGTGLAADLASANGNDVPERALPLTSPVFGSLTGNHAGAYAFYKFDYPGNFWVAKLTLSFSPDDSVVHRAIGLVVYAPDSTAYTSSVTTTLGLQQVRFAADLAGSYLVQVFNYAHGYTINYTLTTQGIPIPPLAPPTPAPPLVTDNTTPAGAIPLVQSVSGSITGSSGGAFAYYTFFYPGDESQVSLDMTVWPADSLLNRGQGFNVYLGDRLIAKSGQDKDDIGRLTARFASVLAGNFLVQVYNYNPGLTTQFTLSRQ